jgi:hypothetical protein
MPRYARRTFRSNTSNHNSSVAEGRSGDSRPRSYAKASNPGCWKNGPKGVVKEIYLLLNCARVRLQAVVSGRMHWRRPASKGECSILPTARLYEAGGLAHTIPGPRTLGQRTRPRPRMSTPALLVGAG